MRRDHAEARSTPVGGIDADAAPLYARLQPEVDTPARGAAAATPVQEIPTISEAAAPAPRFDRRHLRWVALGALVLLPIVLLWVYQAQHVLSRNALVRGDLTEVGTRISGALAVIEVRDGARVKAGQMLARLDDRHLLAQEMEAKAEIEGLEREAEFARASLEHDRGKLQVLAQEASARAAAARAEAAAAQMRAEEAAQAQRVRKDLLASGMISKEAMREVDSRSQVADRMSAMASANARAGESAARAAALEAGGVAVREQRLAVLQANVKAARARLARVQADIEGTRIRAPGDGTVIRWLVRAGGSVDIGRPVVSMAIGSHTRVEAWVDEDDIGRVRIGSPASVKLPSHPGGDFAGTVESIGVITDYEQPVDAVPQPRATRMRVAPVVSVVVKLDDPPDSLLPGLSATVSIKSRRD